MPPINITPAFFNWALQQPISNFVRFVLEHLSGADLSLYQSADNLKVTWGERYFPCRDEIKDLTRSFAEMRQLTPFDC